MNTPTWRDEALNQITMLLESDDRVISLGIFGSLVNPEVVPDQWSDIDLFIVVADGALDGFCQSSEWLVSLGDIFAMTRDLHDTDASIKVIFADFRKVDIVVATVSDVGRHLGPVRNLTLLFSKDADVTARIRHPVVPDRPDALQQPSLPPEMVDEFWFLAFTSVTKLMRNDMLIALHLALELQRMILVLGMILRDRDLGTNVHRTGGVRNEVVARLNLDLDITTSHRRDILALVERSGQAFDDLAAELDPHYVARASAFRAMIERARDELTARGEP